MAAKPSLGRWPLSEVLKEVKERALQAKGIAGAKALEPSETSKEAPYEEQVNANEISKHQEIRA